MSVELWQQCVDLLRDELPAQQFNTWIRPLQVEAEGDELRVYAPNRFVLDWVNEKYMGRLLELLSERGNGLAPALSLLIGSKRNRPPPRVAPVPVSAPPVITPAPVAPVAAQRVETVEESRASLDPLASVSAPPAVRTERSVQVEGALKHTS